MFKGGSIKGIDGPKGRRCGLDTRCITWPRSDPPLKTLPPVMALDNEELETYVPVLS